MTDTAGQTAHELEALIQVGAGLSSSLNLDELLARFARYAAEAARTTFCRIGLLDRVCEILSIRAAYAVRELSWDPGLGKRYSLAALPKHRRAVETHEAVIVRRDVSAMTVHGEELRMLSENIKAAALVPLPNGDGVLGVLTLGEMRSWKRSPFSAAKVRLLENLAMPLSSTLMYVGLLNKITQAYEHSFSDYEQAIEAERQQAMAEFALTIADEFAQPLTGAWGFAQMLLQDTSPADEVYYNSLLNVVKSCKKMTTIVEDLRTLTDRGFEPGPGYTRGFRD
ncbi:MAG: histidine kinase dimerization/phospho-acceptor domain-containing protein [Anaerolineae bacterium]